VSLIIVSNDHCSALVLCAGDGFGRVGTAAVCGHAQVVGDLRPRNRRSVRSSWTAEENRQNAMATWYRRQPEARLRLCHRLVSHVQRKDLACDRKHRGGFVIVNNIIYSLCENYFLVVKHKVNYYKKIRTHKHIQQLDDDAQVMSM